MNWVMPMPQIPNLASQTALVNSLVNNQFSKTVENLQVESSKSSSYVNKKKTNSKSKIVKVCPQPISDNEPIEKIQSPKFKIEESLDDLVEGFDSKSVSLNIGTDVSHEEDEDTESEDTMKLLCKSNVHTIRDSTPSKLRPESIVDRIKNSLSPAPQRHEIRLTQNDEQFEVSKEEDINVRIRARERSVSKGVSQMRDNLARDQTQRRERSATRERSVVRALSQVKEIMTIDSGATKEASVTRERAISQIREIIFKEQAYKEPIAKKVVPAVYEALPQINQIQEFCNSQSSATIPDDMTMSCCSIIERFSEVEGSESEKDLLLRRLTEVIENEKKQVEEDITERQEQLEELEQEYVKSKGNMEKRQNKERDEIKARHKREMAQLMEIHSSEEKHILDEMAKLETELQNLIAPSQLLSTLTQKASSVEPRTRSRLSSRASCASPGSRTDMGDLEQDLQCCSCKNLCKPPSKVHQDEECIFIILHYLFQIFQCPDGDLICIQCKEINLVSCPACQLKLLPGMLSRNKVLENIARKYFRTSQE